MGKTADQRRTIERLELVEFGAIDEAGDHFADIEGFARIVGHDAVQFFRRIMWFDRSPDFKIDVFGAVERVDDTSCQRQRMAVIIGIMVRDAGGAGMDVGSAQFLCSHHFTGGGLYQGRSAEEDRTLVLDDDRLVAHRRHIGSPCRAASHDDGDLRNAFRRHGRLIVKDASEMIPIRKDLVLPGQVRSAGIDKIDAGQAVLPGNLLGAQMLLHRERIVGAALHSWIIGDDHAFAAAHPPDTSEDASGRYGFVIDPVCCELRQFQKWRARVEKRVDAIAGQKLAT